MLYNDLFSYTIILNSRSPRRKRLLEDMGFNICVVKTHTEESYPNNLAIEEIPVFLAEKKGRTYTEQIREKEILLSSDTMVFLDDEALGKPQNKQEAITMLQKLSGRKHYVVSGCNLRTKDKSISFYEKTDVFFKPLSFQEIEYYVNQYEPLDKAGAYGIQEWIGMIGIEKIEGDFYNVMGLPTVSLFQKLKEIL